MKDLGMTVAAASGWLTSSGISMACSTPPGDWSYVQLPIL